MTFLHWNFLTVFFLSILFLRKYNIRFYRESFLILIISQFILFHGLRHYSVGVDSVRYYQRFLQAANIDSFKEIFSLHRFEPLYTLLEGTIGIFTDNYTIFFLGTSLLIFIPVGIFIYKYSNNYFMSIFLFIVLGYFDFSMNVVRQSIAMSISLIGYKYAKEKKFLKFLLIVLIASLFHYSAVVIFPIYFLTNLKPRREYIYSIGILLVALTAFNNQIAQFIHSFYYKYVVTTYVPDHDITGSIGMTGIFMLAIIILGYLIQNPLSRNVDQKSRGLFYIIVTSFLLHSLSTYSYMFKRLSMYYLIYMIIYIPEILDSKCAVSSPVDIEKVRVYQRIFYYGLILSFSAYYILLIIDDPNGILPYLTFYTQ